MFRRSTLYWRANKHEPMTPSVGNNINPLRKKIIFIDGCPIKDNLPKLFASLKRMNFNTHEIDIGHIQKFENIKDYSNFLHDYIQSVIINSEDENVFHTNKTNLKLAPDESYDQYHFFNVSPLTARFYIKDISNRTTEDLECAMRRFHPQWYDNIGVDLDPNQVICTETLDTSDSFVAITDNFVGLQRYGIRSWNAQDPKDAWVSYQGEVYENEQECIHVFDQIRGNDGPLLSNYKGLHTTDSKQALFFMLEQLKVPFHIPGRGKIMNKIETSN